MLNFRSMVHSVVKTRGGLYNMAHIWQKPIFDRTQEDVDFAINKISEWIVYNISSAEYDEKVRIENEKLILREGQITHIDNEVIAVDGDGRAIVDNDALVVKIGVVYDLKGCLNTIDINRIEENIAFLSERLVEFSYPTDVTSKQWSKNDLPTEADAQRIINNIRSLISSFYQMSDAPALPYSMLSYNDVNQIERNIDLIKYLLDCMVNSFHKSGALKSGATIFIPTRR